MPQLKLENVWIQFPFVPYKPQEKFMSHVLTCLKNGQNGLLESPTGTGKTLCLLCASLGWLDSFRKDDDLNGVDGRAPNPTGGYKRHKIYFCSRTHSQLQQCMQEMRNTSYNHMQAAFLASRKHLCINEKVRYDANLDSKCRTLRKPTKCKANPPVDIEDMPVKCSSCHKDHPCLYYENFQNMLEKHEDKVFTEVGPMDHKQLWKKCKLLKVCPFYVSRHLAKRADLIFMPYTYIFNAHILKSIQIELKDSVIIVDEGHNVDRVCEESASTDIRDDQLLECIKELSNVKGFTSKVNFPNDVSEANISELEVIAKAIRTSINDLKEGEYYGGDVMVMIFEHAGFTSLKAPRLLHNFKQLTRFSGEEDIKADGLRKFVSFAEVVLCQDKKCYDTQEDRLNEMKLSFSVYVDPQPKEKPQPRVTHFWCFNASIVMCSIMKRKILSIIVTSGTLTPLEHHALNLGISFPVTLENDHVIDKEQALGLVVGAGPNRVRFNSSQSYCETVGVKYYVGLGHVILDIAISVPGGLLIFFQSKTKRKECLDAWSKENVTENETIFDALNRAKSVFLEPEISGNLADLQRVFCRKIDEEGSTGACLIGVMNGKVSEGVDFKNQYGRVVISIGLPYPPCQDPWVKRKKQVTSLRFNDLKAGPNWYRSVAIRSVNQGIGRVIRHRTDYGAIILLDWRFEETKQDSRVHSALPNWLRRNLKTCDQKDLQNKLQSFFCTIEEKISSIKQRVEAEQREACERYHRDLVGEEVSASQFVELQLKIKEENKKKKDLDQDISNLEECRLLLEKDIKDLKYEISLLTDIGTASIDYLDDSDWDSDGQSQWEELSLEADE